MRCNVKTDAERRIVSAQSAGRDARIAGRDLRALRALPALQDLRENLARRGRQEGQGIS